MDALAPRVGPRETNARGAAPDDDQVKVGVGIEEGVHEWRVALEQCKDRAHCAALVGHCREVVLERTGVRGEDSAGCGVNLK